MGVLLYPFGGKRNGPLRVVMQIRHTHASTISAHVLLCCSIYQENNRQFFYRFVSEKSYQENYHYTASVLKYMMFWTSKLVHFSTKYLLALNVTKVVLLLWGAVMHEFFKLFILDRKIQYSLLKKRRRRRSGTDLHIKAMD
jgi:hypothetical protein